jgi:glycosyltransferase involved in cell wall biosynthesis
VAKLIHFFGTYFTLGGVESILAHHHRLDSEYGLDSLVVSAFMKGGRGKPEPPTLGLTGKSTLGSLCHEFTKLIARHRPEIIIYHNLWGCHTLSQLDGARRRIGLIHTDSTIMRQITARDVGALDGVIAVSPPIGAFVSAVWPYPERIRQIAYPVAQPAEVKLHPGWHQPFRLGFCGRLILEQKRVDRLPSVWTQFRAVFPDGNMEILGDGPERTALENNFHAQSNVLFHGRKSGDEYWRKLAGWDAIIFTSDFEGTPISMLEAMSVGVLPVYPATGSGGDDYVLRLSPALLYRHDVAGSLTTSLQWLKSRSTTEISNLRQKARELVSAHSLQNYFGQFKAHLETFTSLPPLGYPRASTSSLMARLTPFFLWSRFPWTRRECSLLP